jgi:hypothetical protein
LMRLPDLPFPLLLFFISLDKRILCFSRYSI